MNTDCGCNNSYFYGPTLTERYCNESTALLFLAVIGSVIRYNCKINDPCNRIIPRDPPSLDREYDFIIIGGGTGGSVVAGRLAEIPDAKILVIEAGPDEPAGAQVPLFSNLANNQIDFLYQSDPDNGKTYSSKQGKVLGGTATINGMIYTRPIPKDFERWVEAGNPSWSYENMLPILKKSENNQDVGSFVSSEVHGTEGPWAVGRFNYQPDIIWDILSSAKELGWNITDDINDGTHITGMGIFQASTRDGQRSTTAKAYLRPQRDNPNLHIALNSSVSKILIQEHNGIKSAYGVQFLHGNNTYHANASKEVILAAGTMTTPQILLLSGIGDDKILSDNQVTQTHNLTGVGKGLKMPIVFTLTYTISETHSNLLTWYSLTKYLESSSGFMSANGLGQLGGRIASNYTTLDDPDIQYQFHGYNKGYPTCTDNGDYYPSSTQSRRQISVTVVNLHPKCSGYVSIKSNNIRDHPKIVTNLLAEEEDLMVLLYGIKEMVNFINSSKILNEKYNISFKQEIYGNCSSIYKVYSDEFWICAIKENANLVSHETSTCKMGPLNNTDNSSMLNNNVVNENLQVHGIKNLRIADASVFPTLPSANTMCPVVMVAEKAAELITQKYY